MGLEFDFNSITKRISNLDKNVQKNITKKALTNAAKITKEELKKEVELKAYDTGALYESIDISDVKSRGTKEFIYVGSISDNRKIVERLYYNEYGTDKMVGKKLLKNTVKRTKGEATDAIIETIQEELNKV
ncbi:phage protein [[Clostridium] sordellii]|nr:HK97-gp10 family putative phage morphogenesis protein [Paeniclostridium sordellii]CEK29414.1 phage protein [[Clostridium] sordellii] [Paeniclostridium sordellii]